MKQQRLSVLKQVPMLGMTNKKCRVAYVTYTKVHIRKLDHLELPVQSTSSQIGIIIASRYGYIHRAPTGYISHQPHAHATTVVDPILPWCEGAKTVCVKTSAYARTEL